jgi:hypothetical protein
MRTETRPFPFRRKRGDEIASAEPAPPPIREAIQMKPGDLFQLGRKAIGVEERDGELVLVQLAEAPL